MGTAGSQSAQPSAAARSPAGLVDGGALEVYVEPSHALPDGASLRYTAAGPGRAVQRVRYESDDGEAGLWTVWSPAPQGPQDVAVATVWAVPVHDSSAGVSVLVVGGPGGLRLRWDDDPQVVVAEPYLLLDEVPTEASDDDGDSDSEG